MRIAVLVACIALAGAAAAQETPPRMTQGRLHAIIAEVATDARIEGNVIAFRLQDAELFGISDTNADRMRIVAAIKHIEQATPEELIASLYANYHTALDARYAVSNGVIFAVYLHPLSPLTREQIVSAIRQVAAARESFGSSYSSGGPVFGGTR